jgi:hypothetical protein
LRIGDRDQPEHLALRFLASQEAEEDVLQRDDDRAVPLVPPIPDEE